MSAPAAREDDQVVAVDTHIVMVQAGPATVPTPLPHPFTGILDGDLVSSVTIGGKAAAVAGSTATNTPAHIATPPGLSFQSPPADSGTIQAGSASVLIGGKQAARLGDTAMTCNDPTDMPVGTVIGSATVLIGG